MRPISLLNRSMRSMAIVFINHPITTQEKVVLYAITECCICGECGVGWNELGPLQVHNLSPVLDKASGFSSYVIGHRDQPRDPFSLAT